jgi:hypothetical protein
MEEFKIIFIGIIFIIILKFYKYKYKYIKQNEIIEVKKPSLEYYEWKRLYFKMMVLNKLSFLFKNHKKIL